MVMISVVDDGDDDQDVERVVDDGVEGVVDDNQCC